MHAGYTVDVLSKNPIEKAYVADGNVNPQSRAAGQPYPQLEFIEGQFNEPAFIQAFPKVDALIMYSILLHQANLDWDQFLDAWAEKAPVFVIYNQMWKRKGQSVRFTDHDLKWYLKNVYLRIEKASWNGLQNWTSYTRRGENGEICNITGSLA